MSLLTDVLLICSPQDDVAVARVSGVWEAVKEHERFAPLSGSVSFHAWHMVANYLKWEHLKIVIEQVGWENPNQVQVWLRSEDDAKFREFQVVPRAIKGTMFYDLDDEKWVFEQWLEPEQDWRKRKQDIHDRS